MGMRSAALAQGGAQGDGAEVRAPARGLCGPLLTGVELSRSASVLDCIAIEITLFTSIKHGHTHNTLHDIGRRFFAGKRCSQQAALCAARLAALHCRVQPNVFVPWGSCPCPGRGDARVAPPCPTTLCVWRHLPYLTFAYLTFSFTFVTLHTVCACTAALRYA